MKKYIIILRMAVKAEVSGDSAPMPIQDEQKVQVNANVTVVCR